MPGAPSSFLLLVFVVMTCVTLLRMLMPSRTQLYAQWHVWASLATGNVSQLELLKERVRGNLFAPFNQPLTVTKYVILTTPQSGSTMLCDVIGRQNDVFCAGEALTQHSASKQVLQAEEWAAAADKAFDTVCTQAKSLGKPICGFKLMYNQIKGPSAKIGRTSMPLDWFQDYLVTRDIRVLHLVREAAILQLASIYQTRHDSSLDLTEPEPERQAPVKGKAKRMPFTAKTLQTLRDLEEQHEQWWSFLRHSNIFHHYVSYENLMGEKATTMLRMSLEFLGVTYLPTDPQLLWNSSFLKLHKATCKERIADVSRMRKQIKGTMSERACNRLKQGDARVKARVQPESASHSAKYLVLTTQRSGSTWLCDVLGRQSEVLCGHEPLSWYSGMREEVSVKKWKADADKAFDTVCTQAKSLGKPICGFKLMYNQIKGPSAKIGRTSMPLDWFQDYLVTRDIRVLHLVREAVVLTLASHYQSSKEISRLNLTGRSKYHAFDSKVATKRMASPKMPFTASWLEKLHIQEEQHEQWWSFLRHSNILHHYVSYENLMGEKATTTLRMSLEFLGVTYLPTDPQLLWNSSFLKLHKATCEERIADFSEVLKQIKGTMSERACNRLNLEQP
ncbi:unnamed protein product [Durusdinium trenchii]|uniref:Sulphotransferase Stf0 domain-containing protein n=1 Tax=Durusdinium trenchii TaxID=1381693 RepID=A0ABP0M0M7_9DINO